MNKTYRPGAIGALTDEYEKALDELKVVLGTIPAEHFTALINDTPDEDCRSIRNIVFHMVKAGYGYANHIRKRFGNDHSVIDIKIDTVTEAITELDNMFAYTVATFEDKWLLSDEVMMNTIIKTSWSTYDLEALIEHAVVHILRHRLQIQKLLLK